MKWPWPRKPSPRAGLSIFARTFLLLIASLLVAQTIGLALLYTHTPLREPHITPIDVVARLSSRIPATDARLHVSTASSAPSATDGYREDPAMRRLLGNWLDLPADRIRFFAGLPEPLLPGLQPPLFEHADALRGRMPPVGAGPRPFPSRQADDALRREADALAAGLPPERPHPENPGPDARGFDGPGPAGGPGLPGPAAWQPDSPLRGSFVAAARQPDGQWRVVEYRATGHAAQFRRQTLLLFLLGALAMLPMAWWFARALAAPIRRFAEAADRLGRDPHAPALAGTGPSELAQAAESFNTMQARINRLIDERTQMVGAIAHDLRTPLARLAFRLDDLPPAQRDKADADIAEMKTMIATALDFLRDQSSPRPRARLDFGSLVEGVVDGLADTGRKVTLAAPMSAVLCGDADGLRRAVGNLIDNALKYGKRARVSLHHEDGHCVLRVDDDGPGLDPALHERVLLPFVRGEGSRNKDTGGIGLGLAVVRDVALAHGGTLELGNRPEGGLRVTLRLPCEAATA